MDPKESDVKFTIYLPRNVLKSHTKILSNRHLLMGYVDHHESSTIFVTYVTADQQPERAWKHCDMILVGEIVPAEESVYKTERLKKRPLFRMIQNIDGTTYQYQLLNSSSMAIVIYYDLDKICSSFYFIDQHRNTSCWCESLINHVLLSEDIIVANELNRRWSFSIIYAIIIKLSRSICLYPRQADVLSTISSLHIQLRRRSDEILNVNHEIIRNKSVESLRVRNIIWRNGLDVFLGICLMCWLLQGSRTENIASFTLIWADHVATELGRLLEWMMGVPAGLKLNSQLDQLLGNFYLYHVYLWTGYLSMIKPWLGHILWYISLSGCLGLSFQLALLQDLISFMTIHIYCFYVYAARLYYLQRHALASLFRLFRGKKWNVLRSRVDSAQYDVDQLFIGTLLFTVLLFLLPTVLLYYVVFTALRLLVLSVQSFLNCLVSVINNSPVYFVFAAICCPSILADEPEFKIHPTQRDGNTVVQVRSFKLRRRSWSFILKDAKVKSDQKPDTEIVKKKSSLLKCLLTGKLIYPWLNRT